MVDIGQIINGKYRVMRLIGDGGMGSVYEAHHELLGARVALKFLHAELSQEFNLKERFLQEARVSATIHNPHIVRVLDVDVANEVPYLVMDLLTGESLQQRLSRVKRLTVDQTMEYAQQILIGLEAAHLRNIVHRDLKPDNIFITRTPNGELLKILDFGIAKLRQEQGYQLILTQPGAIMGTPEYMAPEQAYSADQVDARSDVYSVGVMLFEMLSGKRPAEGETPQEIAHKILMGAALRLDQVVAELPAGLVRVVHTAIEPRPEDRWDDATALREALLPFLPMTAPSTHGRSLYTAPQTPFEGVKKTPRIDGTRPGAPPAHAPGRGAIGHASEVPIEVERRSPITVTIPPEAGPPRASAVPPEVAAAYSDGRTASMEAWPEPRAVAPAPTVNIPASPNAVPARGRTSLSRSKRGKGRWVVWFIVLLALAGAGAASGIYLYNERDMPVPPPLPARKSLSSPTALSPGAGGESGGPVHLQPLDPEALEDGPADEPAAVPYPAPAPAPRAAPRAAPQPAPQTPPQPTPPAAQSPPAASAPPPPVFTIPTSITLPFPLPTGIPTTFPPVFNLPGLTPTPPPSSP